MSNIFKNSIGTIKKVDTVSDVLVPIKHTYEDGIFLLSDNNYSKTFKVGDINYITSDNDGQENYFRGYAELLNSMLEPFKITVMTRKIEQVTDVNTLFLPHFFDRLDYLRDEFNEYMKGLSLNATSYIQQIFFTSTCAKKKYKEATQYFGRIESSIHQTLTKIGSDATPLNEAEKLELIYNFYNANSDIPFSYDRKQLMKRGHSYKELLCPEAIQQEKGYFRLGDRFGQSMMITDFPQYLFDDLISEILSLNTEIAVSIDVKPVPKDKAIKFAEKKNLDNESNIEKYLQRHRNHGDYGGDIPYAFQQQRDAMKEFIFDLTENDQRMFYCTITLVHLADSPEELMRNSESLRAIASGKQVVLQTIKFPSRQYKGMITALPFGVNEIEYDRTLLTDPLAVLMPFKIQDIIHSKGIPFGINKVSGNLIIIDREKLKNGNSLVFGKPGSGKSFNAKQQLEFVKLARPDIDIIVIDPEREYTSLVNAFNGELINISSTSQNHINLMDINANYGESDDPIIEKSEFILSIFEQILKGNINGKQRSIIDRCVKNVYKNYIDNGYQGDPPTLYDLVAELREVNDNEVAIKTAQELALEVEAYTTGSLNTFAQQTNVNPNNKFVVYDVKDLSSQLMPIGMLVVLDNVFNRISRNREKHITTYLFIDELYLFFTLKNTAEFFCKLWKRIRKYYGYCIGITQNVEDILKSEEARTLISNSEFVVMLSQSTSDREQLAHLLNMSEQESEYITEMPPGEGIIHIENKNIPFVNKFSTDMQLYKLITTKSGEFT